MTAVTTAGTATAVEGATTSAVEPLAYRGPRERAAAVRTAELFELHGPTVLGLCRMLLRNEHEAEDTAQQTFLSAYRSIRNGVEPRHPAAWLATIARNECWAAIERRMREPVYQGEPESGLPDPVAQAAANADLEELWRAIAELPGQQRQALLLREFSGLTYSELAGALGVTEPAVESLLVRARRGLRDRLRPLSGSAAAVLAPIGAFRDALARLVLGMPDAPAASGLARLAAGAAAVVVAGGTVAAVDRDVGRDTGAPAARAAVAPSMVPAVHRGAVTGRRSTAARPIARSIRHPRPDLPERSAAPGPRPAPRPAAPRPRQAEPLAVSAPQRVAAPAPSLPAAAAPEQPVAETPPAAPDADQGPGAGSEPGPSGPGSGEGDPGTDDGGAAIAGDSSSRGPGAEGDGSGSRSDSSGPGGGDASSGEGSADPGGGEESGEGGGDGGGETGGGHGSDGGGGRDGDGGHGHD